jgi:spermidine synthase
MRTTHPGPAEPLAARTERPEPAPRAAGGSFAVGTAVFVAGAVLLGVEIAASRVLAPSFGNSIFVWGSLIGVVLTGLSAGYWLGGVLADRFPQPRLLVVVIGLGAAAVLAVPLVDGAVLDWVVRRDPGPRAGPLLAATILFLPASVVLAGVSPIAVRLRARSVGSVGRTAGHLFALSTAGSIAGTLGTAFWLVPELGTGQLFAYAAVALLVAAAIVAAAERISAAVVVALAAAVGAAAVGVTIAPNRAGTLSAAASRNWSPLYRDRGVESRPNSWVDSNIQVLLDRETRYHHVFVVQDPDTRYLRFDSLVQSAMYRREPFRTRYRYTDFFSLGLAYRPSARDVLLIGLGGGSAPKRLWRDFPRLRIQAVEIDPVVRDVAYRYFALPRDPRLDVDVDDGRIFLERDQRRWDVIMLDAFYADSIPFHLFTSEFLELVHKRLRPGGVVVVNTIGRTAGPGSELERSIYRTYRSAFPTVLIHPVSLPGEERQTDSRNVILVATDQPAPERGFLLSRWNELRRQHPGAPDLTKPIHDRIDEPLRLDGVPILTDDYAPTDSLLLLSQ